MLTGDGEVERKSLGVGDAGTLMPVRSVSVLDATFFLSSVAWACRHGCRRDHVD
jgi:hypothetical protein